MKPYIATFDIESTGVDTEEARIVTACLVVLDRTGEVVNEWNWLLNPGVKIPDEATAVHGITTEFARENGMAASDGIFDIVHTLSTIWDDTENTGWNLPVVIFNAPYDLTLLDREARRWGGDGIAVGRTFDPFVIEKGIESELLARGTIKYRRKGPRKLVNMAEHYGVPVPDGDAHEARYDCILAGRLAILLRPQLVNLREQSGAEEPFWDWLMAIQKDWKKEQAKSLQEYFRSSGKDPDAIVDGSWPLKPFPVVA